MQGASPPIDSVLLIGFGGPRRPDEVMPFLRLVVQGRGVPEDRLQEVARRYDEAGGRSPYNDLTSMQARALERWLAAHDRPLPVRVGMRNWHPFLLDTIRSMAVDNLRHAAGVILAAHRSETSWERYMEDVRGAIETAGGGPAVSYLHSWSGDNGFLEAAAQRIEEVTGFRRGAWPNGVPLIFTAHSIPEPMARRSPYVSDLRTSCEGVAGILCVPQDGWRVAYQSRSGDGRVPWLGPDILDVLRACAAEGAREVVVQAIGFLIDHVEVMYDLDIEAARLATQLGMRFRRAPCVDSHPEFVAMLGRKIVAMADRSA